MSSSDGNAKLYNQFWCERGNELVQGDMMELIMNLTKSLQTMDAGMSLMVHDSSCSWKLLFHHPLSDDWWCIMVLRGQVEGGRCYELIDRGGCIPEVQVH